MIRHGTSNISPCTPLLPSVAAFFLHETLMGTFKFPYRCLFFFVLFWFDTLYKETPTYNEFCFADAIFMKVE